MEEGKKQLTYASTSIEYILSYMKLFHKWDKLLESLKKNPKNADVGKTLRDNLVCCQALRWDQVYLSHLQKLTVCLTSF